MRTGSDLLKEVESLFEEDILTLNGILRVLQEDAVRVSAAYANSHDRSTVTPDDMHRSLMYIAMHMFDETLNPGILQRIQQAAMASESGDSEEDGSTTVSSSSSELDTEHERDDDNTTNREGASGASGASGSDGQDCNNVAYPLAKVLQERVDRACSMWPSWDPATPLQKCIQQAVKKTFDGQSGDELAEQTPSHRSRIAP